MTVVDWLFRDRRTGRMVVGQWPNGPLWVWLGATAVRWVLDPEGRWRTALDLVAAAALAVWAVDEMLRGVNPWRRVLGAVVLVGLVASQRG